MEFKKTNIASTKGLQGSKWDSLYPEFVNPGDTLEFDPEKVSGAAASQAAKRMMVLEEAKGGTRKFHSGVNKVKGVTFVRVRPEGEIQEQEDE